MLSRFDLLSVILRFLVHPSFCVCVCICVHLWNFSLLSHFPSFIIICAVFYLLSFFVIHQMKNCLGSRRRLSTCSEGNDATRPSIPYRSTIYTELTATWHCKVFSAGWKIVIEDKAERGARQIQSRSQARLSQPCQATLNQ